MKEENKEEINYRYCSCPLLLPTSSEGRQHIYRLYYQIQTWPGSEIDPEKRGY